MLGLEKRVRARERPGVERDEIKELHYITAPENLASIMQRGILCHEDSLSVGHRTVANPDVQARRAQRWIPGGLKLHQYANLYINSRNAMMYRILEDYDASKRVAAEDVVVLRVSASVLDLEGVVITDINAAADVEPRWHTVEDGIARLDRDEVFAQYWSSYEHRQQMMAEVLVPRRVMPELIDGAYVVSDRVAAAVASVAPTLDMEVNRYMFFRGPRPS